MCEHKGRPATLEVGRPGEVGKLTFLTSYLMASLIRLRLGRWWSDQTWKFTSPFKIASTSSVSRHRSSTPTTVWPRPPRAGHEGGSIFIQAGPGLMGEAGCERVTCWIRSLPEEPAGAGRGRNTWLTGGFHLWPWCRENRNRPCLTDRGVLQLEGGVGRNGKRSDFGKGRPG